MTERIAIGNVRGPAGAQGLQGVPGPIGPQGPQGARGHGLNILGLYPTLAALKAGHPVGAAGDAWAVGTVGSNTIYIWDTSQMDWIDLGPYAVTVESIGAIPLTQKGAVNGVAELTANGNLAQGFTDDRDLDLYVNMESGSDTTGNGTSGNPYATIAKAVAESRHYPMTRINLRGNMPHEINTAISWSGRHICIRGASNTPSSYNDILKINISRAFRPFNASMGLYGLTAELSANIPYSERIIYAHGTCYLQLGGYVGMTVRNMTGMNQCFIGSIASAPWLGEGGAFMFIVTGRLIMQSDTGKLSLYGEPSATYAQGVAIYRGWSDTFNGNTRAAEKMYQHGTTPVYTLQGGIA